MEPPPRETPVSIHGVTRRDERVATLGHLGGADRHSDPARVLAGRQLRLGHVAASHRRSWYHVAMDKKRSRVEASEALIGMELPVADPEQMKAEIIAGATSETFTIASAQLSASGTVYRCRVANSTGTATSETATLTVLGSGTAPTITQHPQSRTAARSATN